jgi:hypothetical protein
MLRFLTETAHFLGIMCHLPTKQEIDLSYDPKSKFTEKGRRLGMKQDRLLSLLSCMFLSFTLTYLFMRSGNHLERPASLRCQAVPRDLVHVRPLEDASLAIRGVPKSLAWKKGEKTPRSTPIKILPVDFGYYFNPSILELAGGLHVFALRMGWLYGGECLQFATMKDPVAASFHCMKLNKERFVDHTLLGKYEPSSHELIVHDQGPSPSASSSGLQDSIDVTLWDSGAFWHDTRLLFPFNHRPIPGKDKILLTSQNIEILGHDDWSALDYASSLVLQLTYLAAVDPATILDVQSLSAMRDKKVTRWLFYDAELERQEHERRSKDPSSDSSSWKLSSFDVMRLKCGQRPPGLPALPVDATTEVALLYNVTNKQERTLHDDWYFIKDKNWAPFAHDNKVLWSYTIYPHHVICENDIEITQLSEMDVDCIICVAKYNSSSFPVHKIRRRLEEQGYEEVSVHLNGAPAYLVEEKNAYLGLMHIIKTNRSKDELGWERRTRTYDHYFYTTETKPPFRVTGVSSVRAALSRSRGWSHWFEVSEEVIVEFAMYMQYHPDRPGQEFVISYGTGDRFARTATFSLAAIWASFESEGPESA